jgi:cysteine desulfurase/selenocysteine lyase
MTYNIQNDFGLEDPGFALLREVAQRYCPEELQQERKAVLPDEVLNLAAIELLTPPLAPPLQGRGVPAAGKAVAVPLPQQGGVGGGSLLLYFIAVLVVVVVAHLYIF